MSTYAPGTVAIATVRGVKGVKVGRVGADRAWWVSFQPVEITLPNGLTGGQCSHADEDVTDVRPLVVLDLEQSAGKWLLPDWLRNNVRRVEEGAVQPSSIGKDMQWLADQIEAQTKPPRIDEPGLWGVVEAHTSDGSWRRRFVRHDDAEDGRDWQRKGVRRSWDDLIDPTLIREGVNQ